MILQSLCELYERLLDEPESGISKPGYSKAQVSFAFNLSGTGELLDVIDVRDASGGKKLRARYGRAEAGEADLRGQRTSCAITAVT